jgi:hypothetical protein
MSGGEAQSFAGPDASADRMKTPRRRRSTIALFTSGSRCGRSSTLCAIRVDRLIGAMARNAWGAVNAG